MEEICHISGGPGVRGGVDADSETALALSTPTVDFDFEAVFSGQYARVARVIARLVQDPARAEEIAVDVFWKLYNTPAAHGARAGGWLYRTAVRAGLDELRRRGRRARYEKLSGNGHAAPTPEQLYAETERQARVRTVLAHMKVRQAELLVQRSGGSSYQEIADTLEINPASVGTLLRRAEHAFRKEYVKRYGVEQR
jgi:RNA polymerase sigma-70 factor (ECF subfamily)